MRLEFNLVVVDDDWDDDDKNSNIKSLVKRISDNVSSKGFELKYQGFSDPEEAFNAAHRRVDLFLSDNNLGDNANRNDTQKNNAGIDYYLQLRTVPYLCDFVLYTKSKTDEIINKLINDLNARKDPNLFTRFTFVSRHEGSDTWHQPVLTLLDYVLTKREELNNLRGLFAQCVSRMHEDIKTKCGLNSKLDLEDAIKGIPSGKLSAADIDHLHKIRIIRNGLLHNDEVFNTSINRYEITFTKRGITHVISEDNLQHHRDELNRALQIVASL
jgi:hypothetical protein